MFSKIKQFKETRAVVERYLKIDKRTRDSDNLLIARIWYEQLGEEETKNITAFDMLKLMSEGKLMNTENIRRIRCKLQEEEVHLRGDNYEKRHKLKEEVKNQINNL
jgi:lysophospholipase L1-like esterase